MRLGGVVLCGGRSSRMGRPKAWLPLGPETLLFRVARVLGEAASPVVAVAAPGQDVPPLPAGVELVRDEVEGCGPLGGLAAGLTAMDGCVDAVYLSACDAPFLTAEFVRSVAAVVADSVAAVPHVGGRPHPLAAAYRVGVLPEVRRRLVAGEFRMTDLLAALPARYLAAADLPDLAPLRNLNTPDEYAAAANENAPGGPGRGEKPG